MRLTVLEMQAELAYFSLLPQLGSVNSARALNLFYSISGMFSIHYSADLRARPVETGRLRYVVKVG